VISNKAFGREMSMQVTIEIKKRKWNESATRCKSPRSTSPGSPSSGTLGKRKFGRPRQTWRRSTDTEARTAGMSWAELKTEGVREPSALEVWSRSCTCSLRNKENE
jgi:hypothetical protein